MLYFIPSMNHESSLAITTSFIILFFLSARGQQFIVGIVLNQQDYFLGHTMLNILIFLVSVFYKVRFFDPGQTCAQEYACHMKIDADLILSAHLHYL